MGRRSRWTAFNSRLSRLQPNSEDDIFILLLLQYVTTGGSILLVPDQQAFLLRLPDLLLGLHLPARVSHKLRVFRLGYTPSSSGRILLCPARRAPS